MSKLLFLGQKALKEEKKKRMNAWSFHEKKRLKVKKNELKMAMIGKRSDLGAAENLVVLI